MTDSKPPKPRPPADDEEARFDEEGSAVASPQPAETEPPTQNKTEE